MIGVQYNGAIIHKNDNIYETRPVTPKEHLEVARRLLRAGAPANARAEIEAVFRSADAASMSGLDMTEVRYIQALAVLSGRAFDHLSSEDHRVLSYCFEQGKRKPDQEYGRSLLVIDALLRCYVTQQSGHGVKQDDLDDTIESLERLLPPRIEELNLHLGTVLGGVTQERMEALLRAEIQLNRMGKGRRVRVPLFFEPDPIEPVRLAPAPSEAGSGHALRALSGLGALGLAAAPLLWMVVTHPVLIVGFVLGLTGVVVRGPGTLYAVRRRSATLMHQSWYVMAVLGSPPPDAFAARLREMIAGYYAQAVAPSDADAFLLVTAAERGRLEHDLMRTYGPAIHGSGGPDGLGWLVHWNASRTARNGTAWSAPGIRPLRLVVAGGSAVVLAVSVLAALGLLLSRSSTTGVLVLLALLAAGFMMPAGVTWYTEQRRVREQEIELDDRADGERAAYEAECRRLRSRPRDEEMARWLAYDQEHLRLSAMKRYRLTSDDIVSHVLIAEPAENCRRARVVNGPTRCSAYQIRMFFLTNNGVRQLDVLLDFATGAENGERRHAFRYDAIASAEISEPNVHAHGRRQVATPEGGGPADRLPRPVLRQSMRLTLVNGAPILIDNDFVRDLPDEKREDRAALESLAMDTSGAVAALRTLESVAADGRDWLARQRERARYLSEAYTKQMTADELDPFVG